MKSEKPVVSVIMPVFNTPVSILKEAVDSILKQTFRNFEFIIIDDGSEGETAAFMSALTDPRIKLLRNKENIGITKSLNIGFRAAQGKYIARMDSDDYSYPDRFQKQFDFMESHPDVIVSGASSHCRARRFCMDRYEIEMLFQHPGPIHPSAFFNHEKIKQFHLSYDESFPYAQDYALYAEIVQHGKAYLFSDRLIDYRKSSNQVSQKHRQEQIQCDKRTQKKLLLRLADHVEEKYLDMHYEFSNLANHGFRVTPEVWDWYRMLIKSNDQKKIYNRFRFKQYIYRIMLIRAFPIIQSLREAVAAGISRFKS